MAFVTTAAFAIVLVLASRTRRSLSFAAWSIAAAFAASLLVGFLSIVSGFGRGAGLNRIAGDLSVYGLRPTELVLPSDENLLVGDRLAAFDEGRLHGSNPTETNNYVGLLTIASALGWLAIALLRRARVEDWLRHATYGLAAVAVAALVLAAPSPIGVFGHLVPMPSRLVWELVPAIRVPSRWVALAMTALVPLAALALQAARGALERRGRETAAVALVAVALVVSLAELTISPTEPRVRTTPPAEYAALSRTPDGILAEYPLIEDVDQLFWQRDHGRPVLNAGAIGSEADQARRALLHPAAPGTAAALALLGVTAIVTHPDALDYRSGVPDIPNASWGPGYALVERAEDGASVWRIVAPAAPALAFYGGGFGDPQRPKGTFVGFPLVSPAGVGVIEIRAKAPSVARLTFEGSAPSGQRRVVRLADEQAEIPFDLDDRRRSFSVLVDIPEGRSYLVVKTDPAATSEKDAVVLSPPRAALTASEPSLHAIRVTPDPGF
jgi:hypothetical protein